MAYDNTNTGIISVNERKESEKHADYTGTINVGGKEFWLSGWKRKSEKTQRVGSTFKELQWVSLLELHALLHG